MSDYIVSARKYRPDNFDTLIGQDNISRTLRNSILRGQLAHAYLFCGPRGVGKTSTARIFAKTINCSNPGPDMQPCGECESCKSFAEGRSYCIHELDAASNNGVDDIKALMDKVQIPPQTGRYSVYIIDEVHMLSTSAFNAFLKTLEEPPAYAIFILATTEKHKIIPTILSRCQTYDFNRISVSDIARNLRGIASKESISIDEESLHLIAQKADGAMRDALTIFDQTIAFCGTDIKYEDVLHNLNILDYEYSFRLVDAFLKGDYAEPMLIFDEILRKGFNALYFVTALASHLRDLLVSKTGGLDALLQLPDSLKARYAQQAECCSVRFIYDALSICAQCEAGYRASSNQRLHIEFALMKMAFVNSAAVSSSIRTNTPSTQTHSAATQPSAQATVSQAQVAASPTQAAASPSPAVSTHTPAAASPVQASSNSASAQANAADAEKSATSPAVRRRPTKSAASLSLGSLMEDGEPAKAKGIEAVNLDTGATMPSDEVLQAKWTTLASNYESQPRLANALRSAKLNFCEREGRKVVEFFVSNEAQKKWIEEKILRDLEGQFCQLCACSALRLEPIVTPEPQREAIKYMPSEKAEELISVNPEVKHLVSELALDIK